MGANEHAAKLVTTEFDTLNLLKTFTMIIFTLIVTPVSGEVLITSNSLAYPNIPTENVGTTDTI